SNVLCLERAPRFADSGPSDDEMDRGRVQAESQFIFRLQTVGGFGGKSDQLNAYNVFKGDPAYFDDDLARYRAVTPASLQDAVARYMGGSGSAHAVALSVVPRGR